MPLRVVWKCWKDCKTTWGSNRSDLNGLVQCSCSAPWRNPEAKMPRDSGLADFQANFVNASTRETKRIWSDIVSANALRDEEETEQAGQLMLLDGPAEEQVVNEHAQEMFVDEGSELEHAQDTFVDEGSEPLADPPPQPPLVAPAEPGRSLLQAQTPLQLFRSQYISHMKALGISLHPGLVGFWRVLRQKYNELDEDEKKTLEIKG